MGLLTEVRRIEMRRRTGVSTLPPGDARHGTSNGYANYKCRCDDCRDAWAVYHLDYLHRKRGVRPMDEYLAERRQNPIHGTEGGYGRGCRCDDCRLASNAARAARRRRATPPAIHGRAGYSNGCRCAVCRQANTDHSWLRRNGG